MIKFSENVNNDTRSRCLNFAGYPDHNLDPGIFKAFLIITSIIIWEVLGFGGRSALSECFNCLKYYGNNIWCTYKTKEHPIILAININDYTEYFLCYCY